MGKLPKNCGHLLKAKELTNVPFPYYRWMTLLLLYDSYSKAEAFNSYCRLIFTSEDSSSTLHMEGAPFPDMSSISILIEEVYHQLSNLQSNKASGPDMIP